MKQLTVSVINDLTTDQRVHKVCTTLHKLGYEVTLIGRRQRTSLPLQERVYNTKRMFLLFEKGPLFYVEFQVRLFLYLFSKKSDVLLSNDLDTLFPNYLVSKIKKVTLVYDTHELFCEVPELMNRPFKRSIWKKLEGFIFPKLKHVFTVNNSIANIYNNEYGVPITVLRNVPFINDTKADDTLTKNKLGIPDDKKIILLQGAGININRGAEEALQAMQYINNAVLLFIGSGDIMPALKKMTGDLKLTDNVKFIDAVPFEKLNEYTKLADIGLTLDMDSNLNYKYSLPNKLFDYIHAGVPVLATNLVEVKNIIFKYNIGTCINNLNPQHIANQLNGILNNDILLKNWKANTIVAAQELNWEQEEKKLIQSFKNL